MDKYTRPEGSLISFFSNKVKQEGGINLAQGIPGIPPPSELINNLKVCADLDLHQYAAGTGDHLLLEQIQKHYNTTYNSNFDKLDFQITNGATEAISLIYFFMLKTEGSKFATLSFDPAYESYSNLPEIFGQKNHIFQLKDNHVDFKKLGEIISTNNVKLVFVGTPGNPYGKIWTKEEIDQLIYLSHTLNFKIVIDAVYNNIYFTTKAPYMPLEKLDEQIFYVNGFSKMLSITGWRIGYMLCHPKNMQIIRRIHDYTGLSSPSIIQRAIANYLKESNYGEAYRLELREQIISSFNFMKIELEQIDFIIPSVEGGYFIWAELPKGHTDSFGFAVDLYDKEKVAVIPGIHFSESASNYIRINIARNIDDIKEGAARIKRFVSNL